MAQKAGFRVIKNGMVVELAYTLRGTDGEVIDKSDQGDPLTYLHGEGQIVPGLEKELTGLAKGAKKKVVVSAEEGYGKSNPDLKISVKKSQFPSDVEPKVGMQFQAQAGDQGVVFTVAGVEGDNILIDGNHPLADQELHFDIEVLNVRDATKEELEHGHAHGPDGHGHHHHHEHEHGPGCNHDHDDE